MIGPTDAGFLSTQFVICVTGLPSHHNRVGYVHHCCMACQQCFNLTWCSNSSTGYYSSKLGRLCQAMTFKFLRVGVSALISTVAPLDVCTQSLQGCAHLSWQVKCPVMGFHACCKNCGYNEPLPQASGRWKALHAAGITGVKRMQCRIHTYTDMGMCRGSSANVLQR